MSITTYAELQTAIGNWLNRSDLASVAPDFIRLAEADMQRQLRHWEMETRGTVSASSRYTALPANFHVPLRLYVDGANKALQPMSAAEMQDRRFASEDVAGEPLFYAISGGEIELYPTPDATYTVNVLYLRTLPVLSVSNTSNWLLARAPDVYLYGSLLQSAPYLVDDKRLTTWGALYQSGIDALNTESQHTKFGSNLRLRIS